MSKVPRLDAGFTTEQYLFSKGKEGDLVVLAGVSLAEDDLFAKYEQPHIFRIVEVKGKPGWREYTLEDQNGECVDTGDPQDGISITSYLVPVGEYFRHIFGRYSSEMARKESQINKLTIERDILQDTLVKREAAA